MDVQITDTLTEYKWLIFNWVMFILFIGAWLSC